MTQFRSASAALAGSILLLASMAVTYPVRAQNQAARSQQPEPAWLAANRAILAKESYALPPEEIRRLVEAPWYLNVALAQPNVSRKYFLKEPGEDFPPIAVFGRTHLWLGGLEVDPKANRARSLNTRSARSLGLLDVESNRHITIDAPANATVNNPAWSPDGTQLAYVANFENASHVFVWDAATGKSTQLTRTPILATLVTTLKWSADNKSVVTVLVPDNRKPEPKRPEVAPGPLVRLWTDGVKAPERNYWSLLQDPFEADQLEYFTTGQLASIDVKTKAVKKIGPPAMIQSVDPSPDGQYFRVSTMLKPFSYVVQYGSFASAAELWDASGKVVAEIVRRGVRFANDTTGGPAGGGRGAGAAEGNKRGLAWMPQGPGLYYLEAVPGTDSTSAADSGRAGRGAGGRGGQARADRLVQWLPPYGAADTKVLYTHDAPISSVAFTDDAKMVFLADTRAGAGGIVALNLAEPGTKYTIVRQAGYVPAFSSGGRGRGGGGGGAATPDSLAFYTNPGALVTRAGTRGVPVAMVSANGAAYLQGTQYFPDYLQRAPREFVDRVEIRTGAKTRVFESATDKAESVVAALDDDFSRMIVARESPTEVSNAFLRDTKTGALTKLTDNKDYSPEFTNAIRKRIVVTRADGIKFVVRLTLPPDYRAGTRLPGMLWFYPREYNDQGGYDRTLRTENVNSFPQRHTNPRPPDYLTTQGYAVANFDPPIIGQAGRENDNYVSDLVMILTAVIDELDKQGYIDRSRLGIGGHSYGSFSTMNALARTPFFKAGIAGDGMSNRSLTPTAFQSERRDFWTAQETYLEMSPFMQADKIQGALLMYHSMEDTNVGTDPIASVRMMQALRANGKTAALFLYPYEGHQPAAKETELDQWARWTAWLDIYVKHAGDTGKPIM